MSDKNNESNEIVGNIEYLKIKKLKEFENHPFKIYEGERFADMVESIRANGVMQPIIVRPIDDDLLYEILSGHNRVAAAKEAGLSDIPAVVRKGLTDAEALLIVTETNLIQRSFADLKHSERAVALAVHYNAMKKKSGYRSDLLKEIEELTATSAPVGRRSETRYKVGEQYGLSKNTVARYLRVDKLIPALKNRLDNDGIGMRVAESLSYLREKEQEVVEKLLANGKKIDIIKADKLKEESQKGKIGIVLINGILEPATSPVKIKPIKLSSEFLSQHFNENQSAKEIENIISEALRQYLSNQNKFDIHDEKGTATGFKRQTKESRREARENKGKLE